MNNVRYAVKTDKNGKFKVNIKTDTVGNNSVSISFAGNSKFIGSRIDTSFNVVKQDFKISVDKINQVYRGEYAIIGGKFTDANGVTLRALLLK